MSLLRDILPAIPCHWIVGVLYFGDTAANNVKASDHVQEIANRDELDAWLSKATDQELHVLDISLMGATPCVHIFPAVLALAKNMVGFASFARLMADNGQEAQELAKSLKVVQVAALLRCKGYSPYSLQLESTGTWVLRNFPVQS